MKKLVSFVFVLVFLLLFIINPGGGSGATEPKQHKPSCFFGIHRYSPAEKTSRTTSTAVTIKCGGGELVKMGTLVQRPGHELELHGSFSRPDLLLNRGGAIYMKESEKAHWDDQLICPNHINELLTHWKSATYRHLNRGTDRDDVLCSWPFAQHDLVIKGKFIHHVNREEARVYLLATGRHIHVGTTICHEHHREMTKTIDKYLEKTSDPDFALQVCSVSDTAECTREEMIARKFFEFAQLIGINRPLKEYSEYKRDTQRKKVDGVLTVQKWAVHNMAPDNEPELQAAVNARCSRGYASEAEASIDGIMEVIAEEFLLATTPRQSEYVLSLVAGRYPYHVVARYIPSLSKSRFYRAELIAKSGNLHPTEIPRTLDRFDHEGASLLVGYLTSPNVMASNPFGSRTTKLSSGEIVHIPNTIRLMGHAEIIRQFSQSMRENDLEDHLLSASSIHRILRALPADQRHASTCVDKTKAKAFYAFENWIKVLNRLLELAFVNNDKHSKQRYNILEVQLYLRTDYPLHLKEESLIADHCLRYALSDPDEPDFRITLSHDHHHHQCPRCNLMMMTTREMEDLMNEVVDKSSIAHRKELKEMQYQIKSDTEIIWELKHHVIRSVFTDNVLAYFKSTLEEGVGLLIIDFANKFEPLWYNEPQEEFFGKAGETWHGTVLLTKIGDEYVSHTYFHLLHNGVQDSSLVVAILEHVLSDSKKMGVHTFNIRSDNAGPYHSSMTLGSVQWLAERTGTTILSWSFSEQQHGKSDCDRKFGEGKTVIRSYVNTGKDVIDLKDMFTALTSGRKMRGTSIHRATAKKPWKKPDESKLPQISQFGHFEFTPDAIRVWKYKGIGPGRIVPNMDPIETELDVHEEGGHLANRGQSDREKYLVNNRKEAGFWLNDYKRRDDDEYGEELEDRDDDSASDTPSGPSNPRDSLHYCWCGAGFIRYKCLMNHLEWGTHRIIPEKIDMIDYCIGAFKKNLESISNLSPLLPLKDVSDSIFDRSIPIPEEGFAMKKKRKGGRLPAESRKFLVDYYERTMKEGQRPIPKEAIRLLMAVDAIPPELRPTYEQTKSLFSRLSKKPVVSRARRYTLEEDDIEEGEWELDYDEMEECQEDLSRIYFDIIKKVYSEDDE